jgi:hypothetical protein
VESLPAEEQFNVTILCPARKLQLNVMDYHGNPIPSAQIGMIEQMGGIYYNETTSIHGIASINCTIGKYSVKVYKEKLLLNETFTHVFNDTNADIHCRLYNLTISVKIVDYFGQLIPIANVTLQRNGLQYLPSSKSEGIIKFADIVGGNLQINVYLPEQLQPWIVKSFYVDSPSPIEIRAPGYVLLVGLLVETGQLTTGLIIILAVILVLSLEVYRRKHPRSQGS